MLFAIIIGANIFAYFIVQTQLPALLVEQARALALPGPLVLLFVVMAYIVMGAFLKRSG